MDANLAKLQSLYEGAKSFHEKRWHGRCVCYTSRVEPSFASSVHDIRFHVCKEHADQLGIPNGPYWSETVDELSENQRDILKRHHEVLFQQH